jgi:transposase
MNQRTQDAAPGRVIGLDLHPDVFTAAELEGRDAGTAKAVRVWDRRPTSGLEQWAGQLPGGAVVVMEASSGSFEACERLGRLGIQAVVLESQRVGQIAKSYCANDKIDAVKIGRIYLSGLAWVVWQPDATTRERRELLQAYRRAVTAATRSRNRIKSFLCDRGVRLPKGFRLLATEAKSRLHALQAWNELSWLVLEQLVDDHITASERRKRYCALMAREVAKDPQLLNLMRIVGVRHIVAFAVGAVVGQIGRFANSKKLVAYVGLTPKSERSGNGKSPDEGLTRHGRSDLRALLVQSAQNALQQRGSPWHTWGWKLCLRKSSKNIAVAAVARKILTRIWYALRGLLSPLRQADQTLVTKIAKLATAIGKQTLRADGYASYAAFQEEKLRCLTNPA